MSIAIRGTTPLIVATTGNPASGTLNGTRQPQAGDLLVIIHGNDFYALSNMPTPTVGGSTSGVTAITNGSFDTGNPDAHVKSYTYVVGSTGDLTVAVTETGSADEEKLLVVYVLSGADISTPIDGGSAGAAGSGGPATFSEVLTGVTPSGSDAFLIYHTNSGGGSSGGTPYGAPAGFTELYDTLFGGVSYTGGVQQLAVSGATGNKTVTSTGGVTWAGVLLAVKTAGAAASSADPGPLTFPPPGRFAPNGFSSPFPFSMESASGTPIERLTEDFSTKNLALWNYFGTADAVSGRLSIVPHSSYGDGIDSQAAGRWDLRGSRFTIQVVQPLNVGNGSTEAFFSARLNSTNDVSFYISGTLLGMRETVNGSASTTTVTFNATNHQWLRIDHTDTGSILWQASPDGVAWTTLRTRSPGATWHGVFFEVLAGFYGTEPTPGTLLVDNLNVPAGTAFTASQTDNVGLTDTIAVVVAFGRTVDETVGLTDAVSVVVAHARTVDDTAGLSDSTAVAAAHNRGQTDDAGLTDSATATVVVDRSATDTVGLTDAVSTFFSHGRTVTDDTGLTDPRALDVNGTVTDNAGLTDQVSAASAFARTVDDSAGLTDSASAQLAGSGTRQVDDTVGLTDALALAVTATVTDSAGLTDAVNAASVFPRVLTDTAGLTDSVTVELGKLITVTDTAGLTDTRTVTVAFGRTQDDPAGLVDTITTVFAAVRTVDDLLGLVDTPTPATTSVRTQTDTAGLTDSVSASLQSALNQVINDSVGLTSDHQAVLTTARPSIGVTARPVGTPARTARPYAGVTSRYPFVPD